MAATTSLHTILHHFASRQNSAQIHYAEFCEYMKRYAQHNLEEQPDLLPYIATPAETINKELAKLVDAKKIVITSPDTDRKAIIAIIYFIDKYTLRYREIESNPAIPFPVESDLPKHIPADVFEKKLINDFLPHAFESQTINDSNLYGLVFPHDLPTILLPSTVSMQSLLDISLAKIRQMLRKEEYHDYFLKKIRIANPGKELSAKNFFNQVTTKPTEALDAMKKSGDAFYFWSQLCYFIRLDYEKVKDCTQEDTAILQAVHIAEIAISFYKNKTQQTLQRTTALKNLELVLNKPPYYFNKNSIIKFVDSRGIPLLGQYTEEDLNNFLHEATTTLENNNLPRLLVFKTEDDHRYFIYKKKVIPLVARLCTDARETVKEMITKDWFAAYKRFETLPEMKDQTQFENKLEDLIRIISPVLHALLHSNFLPLVYFETKTELDSTTAAVSLFANGQLLPYSELMLLSRHEIATDAKILLPFWYTVPLISWLAALFLKKPSLKKDKNNSSNAKPLPQHDPENNRNMPEPDTEMKLSRKDSLKNAAQKVEQQLVPHGSTIERELSSYEHQWNKILNKQSQLNLTEDVNSLIRDYLRRILRTIQGSTFTPERIRELAETLVKTPALQKIQEKDCLCMYVQLYMVQLVKHIK